MSRVDPSGLSRILSYIKAWVTSALSSKANSNHSHSDYVTVSTNQTITGVKTFNYPAITTKGLRIHSGVGAHGSNGYVKIMTLTITDNYANSCINISFTRRRDNYPSNLYIRFDNAGDADPTLGYFASDYITDCALVKSSTSNWDLYIQKTEAYDRVCITYIHIPEYMDGRITITYKDELASTLPSGYIAASKYAEYLPTSGGAVMGGATKIKIAKSDNNGELRLDGGTDWGNGGSICCHGKDDTLDTGAFVLNASDGTNSRMLMGFPNGTLTWGGTAISLAGHTHTKANITDFPTIPSKTSQLTNDSGFLTSHQSLSSRVAKAGDTMTGTLNLQTENNVCLNLRPTNADWRDTISVQTAGNEAVVFATKQSETSWMFINGEDSVTNHAFDRWQSLTPALQIKSNKVAIGKLIANDSNLTYPLEVNGTMSASSVVVTNNSSNGVVFGSYRVYVG